LYFFIIKKLLPFDRPIVDSNGNSLNVGDSLSNLLYKDRDGDETRFNKI
jgi:hypothetical protein